MKVDIRRFSALARRWLFAFGITSLPLVFSACSSTAMNEWVKAGDLKRIDCLALSYRFGPAGPYAERLGQLVDEQAGALFKANDIPFCGVIVERSAAAEKRATHLMRLTSESATVDYTIRMVTFDVLVELVDLASNEVVFRGRTYGWVQPEVGVGKMLSRPLNSLNDRRMISMPGGRAKYATPALAGKVIYD